MDIREKILTKNKEKNFNHVTINSIIEFVTDFETILGDCLSSEEVIERVFENLNKNIRFIEDKNNRGAVGAYSPKEKEIRILKEISSKKDRNEVLFHEFIHCILRGEKDGISFSGICEICEKTNGKKVLLGTGLNEGIVSIIEEMYQDYKRGIENNNTVENRIFGGKKQINKYYTSITYAKQLQFIMGGRELLRTYLREPKQVVDKIRDMFAEKISKLIYEDTSEKVKSNNLERKESVFYMVERIPVRDTELLLENIDKMSGFNFDNHERNQSESQFFEINREVEKKIKELFESRVIHENVNDSEEVKEEIKKIIQFKTLLIDSKILENYGHVFYGIDNICKRDNIKEEELISKICKELERSSSEEELKYAKEITDGLKAKAFINEIDNIEDGNWIINKIRGNKEIFNSNSNVMKAVSEKIIGILEDRHNIQIILDEDKPRKLLLAIINSSANNFDFDSLDFSIINIKPAALDGLISKKYNPHSSDPINRMLSDIFEQSVDIVMLKDSKGIVDVIKIDGEETENLERMVYEDNRLLQYRENEDEIASRIIEDKKILESELVRNKQSKDMELISIYCDTNDALSKDWILQIDSSNNPIIYTVSDGKISIPEHDICLQKLIEEYQEYVKDLENSDFTELDDISLTELMEEKAKLVKEERGLRNLFSDISRDKQQGNER